MPSEAARLALPVLFCRFCHFRASPLTPSSPARPARPAHASPSSPSSRARSDKDATSTAGGEANATTGIITQLKNNLINTSAELLIAKGRIDELAREKERAVHELADTRAALASAQNEARAGAAAKDRAADLTAQVSKLQAEVRAANDRTAALEADLERDRAASAATRAQILAVQKENGEAAKDAAARLKASQDQLGSVRSELGESRSRELSLVRDKEELQLKLELAIKSHGEIETALEAARRDVEEYKVRATSAVRDSETAHSQSSANISSLHKQRTELQGQITNLEASVSTLKGKVESLTQGKSRAEADVARLSTTVDATQQERDRIAARWKDAETRSADAEAQVLALKSQLADAQTALQIARSKADAVAAVHSAHASVKGQGPGSPRGRAGGADDAALASGAQDAETVSSLRKALRDAEADREAASDILASIIPLPAFVKERASESEGTLLAAGTSRSAAAKAFGAVAVDENG
jgi:chromosome segregation ATPase